MRQKRLVVVAVLVFLSLLLASCGSKDLAALAKMDKGDVSVRDKFGNQVKVPNPADFQKALKGAKKVVDPQDQGKTVPTDYVILNDFGMVYYDDTGKYLVYRDSSGKRQVYQADLWDLISKLALPPKVTSGKNLDAKLSPNFAALSKTKEPWAVAYDSGGKQVVMVTAGQVPSSGFSLDVEKTAVGKDGTLSLTVRMTPPSGAADTVVSYPYVELIVNSAAELDIRLVTAAAGGDKTEHVPVTKVKDGQNIIPVRPERGALVLERVHVAGFVKAPAGAASVEVAVEDGHNVLGSKTMAAPAAMPDWAYFETDLDLRTSTNPYGSVVYRASIGGKAEEVMVPVSFSGK